MFSFKHQLRVRYAETDKMGYVYYGNYAAYYEVARTEMLRSTGISYKQLEDMGVMLPVINMNTTFIKAAVYDDVITINIFIKEKPGIRLKFEYELYNDQGELLNTGATQLVIVNMRSGSPCRPPKIFMDKMAPFFGE